MSRVERKYQRYAWAVLWRSKNTLDGVTEHFIFDAEMPQRVVLFETRDQARKYRDERFGYIRNEPSFRQEPHGWKLPSVVRVSINIGVIEA